MSLLAGRTAIVTGAAGGLGAAFARALTAEGACVVCCDVDPSVEALAPELGPGGAAFVADVSRPEDVRGLVEKAQGAGGHLSVLVNNAGVFAPTHPKDDFEQGVADFDRIMGTNLRGVFLCGRAVAKVMMDSGEGGDIVNVSTDHVLPPPGRPTGGGSHMDVYDASKWGMRGLTEAWARALKRHHIRVNELNMGATDTAMIRSLFRGDPPEEAVATWMRPEQTAAVLIDLLREGPNGRTGTQTGLWVGHPVELAPREQDVG